MAELDKKRRPDKKWKGDVGLQSVYRYFRAPEFFATLQASHNLDEIEESLIAGQEFPELGVVKIKAEQLILGMDGLMTSLGEHHPSHWDVSPSPEEILEEIGNADFEGAAFFDPTTAVVPIFEVPEAIITESGEPIEKTVAAPKQKKSDG